MVAERSSSTVTDNMKELAAHIEHTCLDPKASADRIHEMHDEMLEFGFRGICVSPYFVKTAAQKANGSDYKVVTVVDFPLGQSHTMAKVESIKKAADQGADAVDIVVNYLAAINEDWDYLKDEINTVVHSGHMRNLEVKLILESHNYNSRVLRQVLDICLEARPNYLKTNTGTGNNVNTPDQVKLIQRLTNNTIPIKASGGIRSSEQARELLDMGVELIGASSATRW